MFWINVASTFSKIQPSGLRRIVLGGVQWPVATGEVVKGVKVICIHVWIQYLHCVIWLTGRPSFFSSFFKFFSSWTQRKTQRQTERMTCSAGCCHCSPSAALPLPTTKTTKTAKCQRRKNGQFSHCGAEYKAPQLSRANWAVFLLSHQSSWQRAFIVVMYGVRQRVSTLWATLRGDAARTTVKRLVTFERIILFFFFFLNALQNLPLTWCIV